MKELLYFKLLNCPFCIETDKWVEELYGENPDYRKINIRIIDEQKESVFADTFNYYYVPTFFYDNKKLHEGAANKDKIKSVLDSVLEEFIDEQRNS